MNGYEFKREIERIFNVARNMYPNVTDDMLDTNGAMRLFRSIWKNVVLKMSVVISLTSRTT